ncbi:hypothetical protein ScPMuIL_011524 [Solemya velum]
MIEHYSSDVSSKQFHFLKSIMFANFDLNLMRMTPTRLDKGDIVGVQGLAYKILAAIYIGDQEIVYLHDDGVIRKCSTKDPEIVRITKDNGYDTFCSPIETSLIVSRALSKVGETEFPVIMIDNEITKQFSPSARFAAWCRHGDNLLKMEYPC